MPDYWDRFPVGERGADGQLGRSVVGDAREGRPVGACAKFAHDACPPMLACNLRLPSADLPICLPAIFLHPEGSSLRIFQ